MKSLLFGVFRGRGGLEGRPRGRRGRSCLNLSSMGGKEKLAFSSRFFLCFLSFWKAVSAEC